MSKNINKIEKAAAEMGENTNKSSKRIWTTDETKAFLDAYGKRRFEFESARLKKFAMRNVLEDLTSFGVLTQTTTEEMLKTKLKNLLRAYKSSIDHNKRTGESFIKAPFAEQMEEIFGSKPIMKNSHTITLWEETTEGLSMGRNSFPRPESIATTSAALTSTSNSQSAIQNIICPQAESSISTSSPAASNKKNRLSVKEKYYLMKEKKAAEKNEILRTYTEEKLKKVDEAERAKESRFERKEKLLGELFNKP